MTDHQLSTTSPEKSRADVVVVGVVQTDDGPRVAPGGEAVVAAYGEKRFAALVSSFEVTGKPGTATRLPTETLKAGTLLLVGLGPADALDPESVRRGAGVAARHLGNVTSVALALPAEDADHVRAVVEGFELGGYRYRRFKSDDPAGGSGSALSSVTVLSPIARKKEAATAQAVGRVVAAAVARTRDWVNCPPGDLTPPVFAEEARDAAPSGRGSRVEVTVLDDDQLREGGYGGLITVGKGSAAGPRLVEIAYTPKKPVAHLALVGKGITFDSGGLSIKPAGSMATMKSDMGGAAAVIAATYAIAELGLPVQVTAFAPMAENMVSGAATRPGDVYTTLSGRTVEVLNTDAEGRLVLADGLTRAVAAAPDLIVDVATLTGACVVALGNRVTGVMGDPGVVDRVLDASGRSGEQMWPLPIPEEMTEKVRGNSKIADLAQHNTERWGGALYAAAFLREFAEDVPWGHLDIAGPSFNDGSAWGHVTPGGTGAAAATLIALAEDLAERGVDGVTED
ncbi:leucyl aminopeptidase [Nocardioidaceae bacterium]|nr:leucyl aminopeptidase [Nocardioidaceae bacterium]